MSAIDEYLSSRAKISGYSGDAIGIYKGMLDWQKKQDEEEERKRRELLKKQSELNDEASTVKKEAGLDDANNLVKEKQENWNGEKIDWIGMENPGQLSKAISNILTFGGTSRVEKDRIAKNLSGEYDEAEKKLAENKADYINRIGQENYYKLLNEASSKGSMKGDSLSGYASDIKQGDLQVKRNSAWDRYLTSGMSSDRQLAERYDEALRTFQYSNPDAGKQIFSGTANYLPQAKYYAVKNLPGTLGAVGAYALISKLTGNKQAAGAVAGKIYGTSQIVTGFQGTMEQTRGGEFGDMVTLGIPEDIAREASQESAFWQSLIEEGETAFDIYNAFKVPQSETVTKGLKQFFKNWGMNIITEGLEEGSQSVVGFVYEKDAARRAGMDLSEYTIQNMFSQALEEAKGGMEIGATMYIAEGLPHIVVGAVSNNRNERIAIQSAPANLAVYNATTTTDDYGNQTINEAAFKKELVEAYDTEIATVKEAATNDTANAKSYERIVKELEAGKKKATSEKGFKALVDGANKELDAQQTNKAQTLNKRVKDAAIAVLTEEQNKARTAGFSNMEFNVAENITVGQKNLAKFAKNNLGLNIVYYLTKNGTMKYTKKDGTESTSVYKHRGIWIDGNTVYVNARLRTTKNAMSVIGHEYAHDLIAKNQDVASKVYGAYSNEEAIEYGRNHGWNKPGFMSQEEINGYKEEMFADDVGEYLSRAEVINMIEDGDKSAEKVIKDTIANYLENTSGYRPQFDNISQFNMSGTSVLNGVELREDLKEVVNEDVKKRQQKKKLSKKETTKEETKKEVSKTETKTATRLTDEQKKNNEWYREQRENNVARDQIQKSLAVRMKKSVNSQEVKDELARLEKKYNQENSTKRSSEISPSIANEEIDNQGNVLSVGVAKRNRNSKVRDSKGRLIRLYHGTTQKFDTFDKKRNGRNFGGFLQYGDGFYLTPDINEAERWAALAGGTEIMEEYVNIENPFYIGKGNDSETINKMAAKIEQLYDEKYRKDKPFKIAEFQKRHGGNIINILQVDLKFNNAQVKEFIESFGFDGIMDIYEDVDNIAGGWITGQVVAYKENQIKDVTNQNPTDNPNTHLSAEIDDGKNKNTRAEKWKSKAKENEQKAKANKREARGRGRALRWSWKKEEQQRKQKEKWKAKTEKRERVIAGLRTKAKEKQRVRTLNIAKRELLGKIKRFEKSKTFKFMTDEQKKIYQEIFGNIYKGGLSKKNATKQRELIKAQIAQALIDDPNIVVSQRIKNMVTSPNKVTLDTIQTIDEMNELLDAFSKITEQVQKQQQLVGLSKAKDALEEQKKFADAIKELDAKHEESKYVLKAKREARDNNALGKFINTLQSGTTAVGESLSRFFETALSTIETELLRVAGGNRNSKIMDLYKNLNEGVTRERAVIVRLRNILNKYLTEDEYKTLRRQLNPKTDWYDTGAEVTDTNGRKHKLIIDHGRLISLAMHSMQEQSLKHIGGAIVDILLDEDGDPNVIPAEGGGLVIPDMEFAKKGQIGRAVAEGYTVKLTPEEINAIVGKTTDSNGNVTFSKLTKQENDFIKGIQEFFNQTKEYTNEVYKTLKGFGLPDIENYFPLIANKAFIFRKPGDNLTAKNIAQAYGMFDKMGFVQERNPNAYNPIVLENVADVLSRMMDGVAKYYGYNIALHNNEVLLNTIDGTFSVRDALGRIAPNFIGTGRGKGNYDVLTGFISGTMAHPNDVFAKWRGRHAEFTLGLNPGSWIKQLLSVPTTAKYFTTQEILGFATGGAKELYDTMKSYLESVGDYERGKVLVNFVRNLTNDIDYRSELFGLPDISDKIDDKSLFETIDILKGISRADRLGVTTVTRMFLYAELSRRNLLGDELTKISAEEADKVFQEVGYELERFLRQTQPDYSQVYRANISRNSGTFARFITMYSTPTLQMMNNMLQAAYELDYAMKNGDTRAKAHAWNVMLKSGMGVFVASLGSVLISRAISLLLQGGKKDDDDYDLGKELVVSMLAPTLVLDDLARGFLGMTTYESQTPELIAFDAITEIGSSLYEIANGKSENAYNKWKKIATNLGLLFGIPARDLYKIGKAVLMYADSDLYYNMALRENTNAYKKWIETEGSPDIKDFYKAYTATREKVLESKYGYHKADKEKNIKSNKKESFRKALQDVFGNDTKKINEYMTILGGYKS